jgi:hypothetical protein
MPVGDLYMPAIATPEVLAQVGLPVSPATPVFRSRVTIWHPGWIVLGLLVAALTLSRDA